MQKKRVTVSRKQMITARTKAARAFADWADLALAAEGRVAAVTDLAEGIREAFAKFDAAMTRQKLDD